MGVEFGSTQIKSVIADGTGKCYAAGEYVWENRLENGLWTYSEADIWRGLRGSFADLCKNYGGKPELSGIGLSGMMHGYIALDGNGKLLVPFRTWRNTNTGEAAEALTRLFGVNIPMRWSIAHLYQSILNGEEHVKEIACLTTLSGYVHYKLTGEKVLGIGDASGMFPIDPETGTYDERMLSAFDKLTAGKGYPWKLKEILPKVLKSGEEAGKLTEDGAKLLDAAGGLRPGIGLCPPEGDAGTGMVATDSVEERRGNVSAGTSVFAMVVLEKPLSRLHTEIDAVTTPDGKPVAMVHCNNCTSDINAWAKLFQEVLHTFGKEVTPGELMTRLFEKSTESESAGGLTNYNYFSGEPVAGLTEGRPLFLREADGALSLADFMKAQIYSAVAGLALGMEILREEDVRIDEMCGHGGFFKTPEIGQSVMSAAVNAPVTVSEHAGEGGAWGIALLAAYMVEGKGRTLSEFLSGIFVGSRKTTLSANEKERRGFADFLVRYKRYLAAEKAAAEA